jgi:cation diffusion facilitator CzcD-associated flavoprotein CzcO
MPENAATSIAEGMGNGRVNTNPQYFETVIIGSGFSGLLAAIRLKEYGLDDFVLLERSSELGGTWRDNSYPGAEVDVPTGLYSISFIPYPFKKRYAPQSELLEYTNYIIDKFHLREYAKANQTVTKLTYDESQFVWHVEVASGERYVARFIIDTSGVLANPRTPYIEGAESFRGATFHTAQWDHTVPYEGKRVGVIGSGCSAAQVVPAIADRVARLTVFMGREVVPKFRTRA